VQALHIPSLSAILPDVLLSASPEYDIRWTDLYFSGGIGGGFFTYPATNNPITKRRPTIKQVALFLLGLLCKDEFSPTR
jgi:hypothetical protein